MSGDAHDVLRAVAFEIAVAPMIARLMQREGHNSQGSSARLGVAMARLIAADGLINGC